LVVVGATHKVKHAITFKNRLRFPGEIYFDPGYTAFKALNCPRLGVWEAAKKYLNQKVVATLKALSSKYQADTEGDGLQTGAVVVVGPGANKPLLYHWKEVDEEPDAFAPPEEILRVCGWTEEMERKWETEHPVDAILPPDQGSRPNLLSSGGPAGSKSNLSSSSSVQPKGERASAGSINILE